ncbi:MAG: hypothetical protein GWN01_12645, partial [Nitrosopumilaceae archaeon]|nr:hypothetical protein [Nitrosopumilaceae archaeon]NIX62319.1 hypothetical protein [Nitrosopumilaceae archaeon]
EVFTQQVQKGLLRLEDDKFIELPGSQFIQDEELKSIVELPDGQLLIGTSKGFYTYDGTSFSDWNAESIEEVIRNNVNVITRTKDKIIIGTILN